MRPLLVLALLVAALCLMDSVDAKKKRKEEFEERDEEEDFDDEDEEALGMRKSDTDRFENLNKEERKKRMGIIFGKMDADKDGSLTGEELVKWIKTVMARNDQDDLEEEWAKFKLPNNTVLTWEVYAKKNKKYLNEKSDKKKWQMADLDKDGKLSKGEFGDFLAPDSKDHMKDAAAMEAFDSIDKNEDGQISKTEFLDDLNPDGKKKMPKWVAKEMEKFNEVDTDNDGQVTFEQVRDIISPPGFDYAGNEAKLLIKKADTNKDGKVSLDEMLQKQKLFADSEATAHGDALMYHDEF